jgi:hypothetical protein
MSKHSKLTFFAKRCELSETDVEEVIRTASSKSASDNALRDSPSRSDRRNQKVKTGKLKKGDITARISEDSK